VTDTTATKSSTDFTLTSQLTRALRTLVNDQKEKEWAASYDLVGDTVTALSRTESVSAHAALARAAALIGDLNALQHKLPKKLFEKYDFQQEWNRILRLAWQSVFFLEDEFCITAVASGLDHFAPMYPACGLFPGLDRPAAVELAEAA
jgi:predicted solute-binding protein